MNNTSIRAVIVDDEQSARTILKSMLEKYCPQVEVVGETDNVPAGKTLIQQMKPHVIFLDIEMPTGSGFDLLKELGPTPAEVIFITAHNQYAIHAIKMFALDYLLKPINRQELMEAVEKVQHRDARTTYKILTLLSQQLESKRTEAERLVIPSLKGLEIIKVSDIVYCEGDRNYTTFYFTGKEKLLSSKTLKEYEKLLPLSFVRVHQKHIVNINFVKQYLKGRGGTLIMTNGKSIDVSHSKKAILLQALGQKTSSHAIDQ